MTPRTHELYFSADELRAALKLLGNPGTYAEGTVAVAAETLASIIEYVEEEFETDEQVAWTVSHYLDPSAARQSGRPHVVLDRIVIDGEDGV